MKKIRQQHVTVSYTLANAPKDIRDLVLKHHATKAPR
jgi:hypothetical protein